MNYLCSAKLAQETMEESNYNPIQGIKRHFFAMRNGIIADTLRKAGSPFRYIFGLNIPQIADIAAQTGTDSPLAEALWANTTTRESMLLAPMIADKASFSIDDAMRWVSAVPATEVADILCHRLLRHQPYAWELAEKLAGCGEKGYSRYTAMRLAFNLLSSAPERALAFAQAHAGYPLAPQIIEEAEFVLDK